MTKVTVIGKITVARNYELVIDTGEGVLIAQDNVHPHAYNINIAVLAAASITVYN